MSSDNGKTLSGNVSINLAAANTTTAYIVNFAYNANWIVDVVNKTITASNVVCVDRGGDPLVIGTTNTAFEACGDGVAPEPGFVNFIQGVLSNTAIKAVNASGDLSIIDNGAGAINIVFTTGDSVGNIYNFTLTY